VREFMATVCPAVLIKTIYEKQFIVVEAKAAIQNSVANMPYTELVFVLVDGCKSKNLTLAELSIGYLQALVKNLPAETVTQGVASDWMNSLLSQLHSDFEGKRMKIKKQAEEILRALNAVLGAERVAAALQSALLTPEGAPAQDKIDKITKLIQEKEPAKGKTDQRKDFRSFLKSQKQQVSNASDMSIDSASTTQTNDNQQSNLEKMEV
jgi:hypothetical protein